MDEFQKTGMQESLDGGRTWQPVRAGDPKVLAAERQLLQETETAKKRLEAEQKARDAAEEAEGI